MVEVCGHHLHTEPEPPSERLGAQVPGALERLVLRMLSKNAQSLPASAEDLLERLDALEGVPDWTRADREAWWSVHGEALRAGPTDLSAAGDTL